MATGERTFNVGEQKLDNFLVPAGNYTARLRGQKANVKVSKGKGVPYVSAPFTMPNANGKDMWLWQRFDLSLATWKNGSNALSKRNSIVALSKSLGEKPSFTIKTVESNDGDVDVLDPDEVLAWLRDHDGIEVPVQVRIEEGTDGFEDKSVIAQFKKTAGTDGPA